MSRVFVASSSQYLEVNSAAVGALPFTMACWFRTTDDEGLNYLMWLGDKDTWNEMTALKIVAVTPRAFSWAPPSSGEATASAGGSINTWYHAAGVWASTTSRAAFFSGGNKGTNATAVDGPTGYDRTSLGRCARSSPGYYFDGQVAEAAIWDVALTDAQIVVLATGVSPLAVQPQNLVFYMPLVRDNDDDIVGGLSLTPYNSPTVAAHPRILYTVPWVLAPPPPPGGEEIPLAGTSDGVCAVAGALSVDYALAGASDGTSTVAGAVELELALAGTADGVASVSGAATVAYALAGMSDGVAASAGNVIVAHTLAGASDGAATSAGALALALVLAGVSDGVATAGATLRLGALQALAGSSDGVATSAGILSLALALAGASDGVSTADATILPCRGLAGTSDGAATSAGALALALVLAGVSDGAATAGATILPCRGLAGTSDGVAASAGVLNLALALAGVSDGLASTAGALSMGGVLQWLAGTSDGAATAAGALSVWVLQLLLGRSVEMRTVGTASTEARLVAAGDGECRLIATEDAIIPA